MDLTEMPIIECLECQRDIQQLLLTDNETRELICEHCLEKQTTCFNRMVLETREMEASVQFVRNNFDAEASAYCAKARISQDRLFQEKRAIDHYQKMKAKMQALTEQQKILQKEERELIDELMNLQQKEVFHAESYNRQAMQGLKLFESLLEMDEKRNQLVFYENYEDDIYVIGHFYEIVIRGEKVFVNQQQINEKTYFQLVNICNLLEIKYRYSSQGQFSEKAITQIQNQNISLLSLERVAQKLYHLWQYIIKQKMVEVNRLPYEIQITPEPTIESLKFTLKQNITPIILRLAVDIKFLCSLQISFSQSSFY